MVSSPFIGFHLWFQDNRGLQAMRCEAPRDRFCKLRFFRKAAMQDNERGLLWRRQAISSISRSTKAVVVRSGITCFLNRMLIQLLEFSDYPWQPSEQ
jgi:hypothetical protein